MPKYLPIVQLIVVLFFSLLSSCFVLFNVLKRVILSGGPSKYLSRKERERTRVLDDPDLGTHGYLTLKHQNLKIHYVAKGDEGKPLMLFLHGFPEFWYSWRHQLREFGKDYRAVAIDMRGYGESDKPEGIAEYHLEKLTADIKDVIHALGYEKAIVVSHDWGGVVAWMFSMRYPEMAERLIVCNCPHGSAFKKHMETCFSQKLKSWYMIFFQLPWLPEIVIGSEDQRSIDKMFTSRSGGAKPGSFSVLDLEAFKYTFGQPGALTGPINYYRAAMRYQQLRLEKRVVQCPALIVWGTGDSVLEKCMAEMSRKYCNDLTIKYIEGASHWVQQDEPKAVNKLITDFLNKERAE